MRGFPKTLNSKEDYYNIKEMFPDQWREHWQALLETTKCWYPVREVTEAEKDTLVLAANQRIERFEHNSPDGEDGKTVVEFFLYEEKENPDCKLKRLGMTKAEVEKALKAAA